MPVIVCWPALSVPNFIFRYFVCVALVWLTSKNRNRRIDERANERTQKNSTFACADTLVCTSSFFFSSLRSDQWCRSAHYGRNNEHWRSICSNERYFHRQQQCIWTKSDGWNLLSIFRLEIVQLIWIKNVIQFSFDLWFLVLRVCELRYGLHNEMGLSCRIRNRAFRAQD